MTGSGPPPISWKCPVCGTRGDARDPYAYRLHLIRQRMCRESYAFRMDYLKQSLQRARRRGTARV